jgi:hypothetical protein
VEGCHKLRFALFEPVPVLLSDFKFRFDYYLGRNTAETDDYFRLYERSLCAQPADTGLLLVAQRVAVLRRAAFHDIGDKNFRTVKPDHGEQSYQGRGRLVGKTALITGGDSGIGRAVAIAFAREGADVAISYLKEEEADARETIRWVEEAG